MSDHNATHASQVLAWYDRHGRVLPWRAPPGKRHKPYIVWLSEIMLQQTTVATVGPYFKEFLSRWPTVEALAAAKLDDVLHCWQGLGYYARARNMHRCAIIVAQDLEGHFPKNEKALVALPGIGPYTAAAIRAIAFDKRAVVVDGNVERVMARLFREKKPLPGVKEVLRNHADRLTPNDRPGDYAQAVMDLGATICLPRRPKCSICPWMQDCRGRNIAEKLPARRPRPKKPIRRGAVFWIERPDGTVLLRRRLENGLLGGMIEFPSSDWREGTLPIEMTYAIKHAPLPASKWFRLDGLVRHTFTHFHLELVVFKGHVTQGAPAPDNAFWSSINGFADQALPTVMKKVAEKAITFG
ncbi:MAG: A/G-specific adenine glycosylase [Pseudomonadota bacterium]|nr:A/G-specific adenine glycosylase [Pseudomonadota bacterium]